MKLRFRIDSVPPSYNRHFKIAYGMRQVYLSQEAKLFKTKVKCSMPAVNVYDDELFSIHIHIHSNWYYKNGRVKKHDIQNLDKLLIDAIFEKLGVDDSRLFEVTLRKVQNATEGFTMVELIVLNNFDVVV